MNTCARDRENGVAERGRYPAERFLANSGDRVVCRSDKMNGDFRHFRTRQQWKVMKITLDDATSLNRYLLFECGSKSHNNLHLDLPFGGQRVYQKRSGVHRQIKSFGSNLRSEERRVGKECRSRWSPYH